MVNVSQGIEIQPFNPGLNGLWTTASEAVRSEKAPRAFEYPIRLVFPRLPEPVDLNSTGISRFALELTTDGNQRRLRLRRLDFPAEMEPRSFRVSIDTICGLQPQASGVRVQDLELVADDQEWHRVSEPKNSLSTEEGDLLVHTLALAADSFFDSGTSEPVITGELFFP